jgi:hypothetical protein
MTKVVAGISMSLDGFVAGPHDGVGRGLGEGGEPIHNWVMGGPWTYSGGTPSRHRESTRRSSPRCSRTPRRSS